MACAHNTILLLALVKESWTTATGKEGHINQHPQWQLTHCIPTNVVKYTWNDIIVQVMTCTMRHHSMEAVQVKCGSCGLFVADAASFATDR